MIVVSGDGDGLMMMTVQRAESSVLCDGFADRHLPGVPVDGMKKSILRGKTRSISVIMFASRVY